jgi:hypothetical protein
LGSTFLLKILNDNFMKKQKITIDKKFILSSSYEEYKYLTEYMVAKQECNYRNPGITMFLKLVIILFMHIIPLL